MNLAALAEKVGRSRSAVSYWTLGKSEPSLDDLVAIHEALGVSVDWLLGLTEHRGLRAEVTPMLAAGALPAEERYRGTIRLFLTVPVWGA